MKNKTVTALLVAMTALIATSCGSYRGPAETALNSSYSAKNMAAGTMSASDGVYAEESAYDNSINTGSGTDNTNLYETVKNISMMIRDADISVDVKDLYAFQDNLLSLTESYGGYAESSTINDYENIYSTDRYAYYTLRIPNDRLDDFLSHVDGEGTVTSRSITTEDVSLEYVDLDAHIKALEQERDELTSLMDTAESVEDVIRIKEQLANVQYELDSLNGRMENLKGRVAYSTVRITAHEERNVEHPIRMALEVNFRDRAIEGVSNAVEALVTIVTGIPLIIIVTTFAIAFVWILRKIIRRVFKKKDHISYVLMPVMKEAEAIEPDPAKSTDDPENTKGEGI